MTDLEGRAARLAEIPASVCYCRWGICVDCQRRKKAQMDDELPRRIRVDRMVPAELAIRAAVHAVEEMPAASRLTDAVILLGQAQNCVADFVDGVTTALTKSSPGGLLAERARWYRDGCDGLEDREGYFASGDVARDAASDLDSALAQLTAQAEEIAQLHTEQEQQTWTCFHCGERFTTPGGAADHFGANPQAIAGCLIQQVPLEKGGTPEAGRGLLMALRKAEAEIVQLRADMEIAKRIPSAWAEALDRSREIEADLALRTRELNVFQAERNRIVSDLIVRTRERDEAQQRIDEAFGVTQTVLGLDDAGDDPDDLVANLHLIDQRSRERQEVIGQLVAQWRDEAQHDTTRDGVHQRALGRCASMLAALLVPRVPNTESKP